MVTHIGLLQELRANGRAEKRLIDGKLPDLFSFDV